MAKIFVQDPFNPICFLEDSEKYIEVESIIGILNSVMPALKRTRLTASAWRKANWCINCVLMRVMERRERDNS